MFLEQLFLDVIIVIVSSCLNEIQQARNEQRKEYYGKKTVKR
ncbi:hypothetical protein STH8232_1083 [Streptococcus thermophilus JIM 8232]|nr:hypothetical protein STH8232_1083 [Streptococcus thermophilus JIM 8232]